MPGPSRTYTWRGRRVAWEGLGERGPAVVLCHGTPWSSWLWRPYAEALAASHRVFLWDMPGYGMSSKDAQHDVALDVQTELFVDLLQHWDLDAPHVVAHDIGGAVALRAHLLHGASYASLALVDVVALRPWGSDFFTLVREHTEVFARLPAAVHAGALNAYIRGAAHREISPAASDALARPWLGDEGQAAFYRQIGQADERFTDEIEALYPRIEMPTLVVWGREDRWIPVDRAHRLHALIEDSRLELIDDAGHLVQLDRPVRLATVLTRWLGDVSGG